MWDGSTEWWRLCRKTALTGEPAAAAQKASLVLILSKTWRYHEDPESKMESMQKKHRTFSHFQRVQGGKIDWKVITGDSYADTLAALRPIQGEKSLTRREGAENLHQVRSFKTTVHMPEKAQAAIARIISCFYVWKYFFGDSDFWS